MKRIQPLKDTRVTVLKALVAGGRVECRRCYPYPAKLHLIRIGSKDTPPIVKDYVLEELIALGLVRPSKEPDLSTPEKAATALDTVDYVATPAAHRAVKLKGIEYEDTQDTLFGEDAGKYEPNGGTGMEPAWEAA